MKTAEKLVFLRKQKGLTQLKLAEILDVSRQAASRWEVGDALPSTENLKCLSNLYGVPFDYLINDEDEWSAEKKTEPSIVKKDEGAKNNCQIQTWKKVACLALISVCLLTSALVYMLASKGDSEQEILFGELEEEVLETDPEVGFDLDW